MLALCGPRRSTADFGRKGYPYPRRRTISVLIYAGRKCRHAKRDEVSVNVSEVNSRLIARRAQNEFESLTIFVVNISVLAYVSRHTVYATGALIAGLAGLKFRWGRRLIRGRDNSCMACVVTACSSLWP